ncbi:hypothetical protein [Nocardia terpenica]|uniref:Uncharacterized protein n=1 Tax=Nocardia terpenica TaxID=455432 RepID=A0A6G9ZDB0_9NOCA|nr:hypothetical protein [Nocardia terpenica]QIS23528.1 hypothetical protein F6W96_39800 [Nocardia terpenica]
MGDFVIRTGDTLAVTIPDAVIPATASPVPLAGSSKKMTVEQMPVCLEGDELPESLQISLVYTTSTHTIPGSGNLTLTLTAANKTAKTKCEGKAILIKGGDFTAKFDVTTPAQQPGSPPTPDPQQVKNGTAKFVTTNRKTTAG